MIVRDLRLLLEKLNDECTRATEAAVGYCVTREHYEFTWLHLLHQLCDSADNDISRVLAHFNVDKEELSKAVSHDLDGLARGSSAKPSFSPPLIETMERAWNLASLYYNRPLVSSGILFVAALDEMQRSLSEHGAALRHIDAQKLRTDFETIVAASSEQKHSLAASAVQGPASVSAAGKEALEQFCTNFTRQASEGKIDPISGRDEEIRQVLDILSRRRKNNPILVGEAGVGKTAVVEGLALRIVAGDVPDSLKGVELWGLDLGLLQAGAGVKGEFEKRLKNVIQAVTNSAGSVVLFIDEAHTLIGAGGAAGQGDAANLLKPALARGELRTCAATTWSEYRRYFEKDPALARRFQLVKVEEPAEEQAIAMLRGVAARYEEHHGVHITDEGVRAAVRLSRRYIAGRQLPDKAVDVLDTAGTRVKMSRTTTPAPLDRLRRALSAAQVERDALLRDRTAGIAVAADELATCESAIAKTQEEIVSVSEKWEREKTAANEIVDLRSQLVACGNDASGSARTADLRKQLEEKTAAFELLQGETPLVFPHVSAAICGQVISDWTGIPLGSLLRDEAQALLELEDRLGQRVLGQEEAINHVADRVRSAKAGLGNPNAPMGVFLFAGPSGVGKTECALALADTLFGGEKFLTVINMSEYQEKHTVSQLKGSPPGYVGFGEGGVLTEAVRQKPYSIVVLDEVEKAHIEVMNLFYQVFDKGIMRDGEGREIDFRNTLIIMTSNLGSSTIIDMYTNEDPSADAVVEAIRPELSAHFQPALLGRMTVVPFAPLKEESLHGVVALKLDSIARRLEAAHGVQLVCSAALIESLAKRCTTAESGARAIEGLIGQSLLPQISRQLIAQLGEDAAPHGRIVLDVAENGETVVTFEDAGQTEGAAPAASP